MKTKLFLIAFFLVLSVSTCLLNAEDVDPGIKAPVDTAKEYIAQKYNCNVKDLTVGDSMIGKRAAHIDVNHGYKTDRVILRYNEIDRCWEAEDSEPLHQY